MTLLSIDPSSTCTGYAVLSEKHELVDYGVWKPTGTKARKDPFWRIEVMCQHLDGLLAKCQFDHVVVEVSSGHVSSRHRGGGSGLATYGTAVGALWSWATIARKPLANVHVVYENEWTGGLPKRNYNGKYPINRHDQIVAEFKLPRETPDDITDAIGLGMWWFDHRKLLKEAGMAK